MHYPIAFLMFGVCSLLQSQDVPEKVDSTAKCDPAAKEARPAAEEGAGTKSWLLRDAGITGGQITLPFKIRRHRENHTFRLTTDVTLGGYVGYTKRLSKSKDYSLTVPLTAGLTFINLNTNNTALSRLEEQAEVVPGLSWSTGVILQLEKYSLGLLVGKDYAGDVGNEWEYHGKLWWSFGIGFVFMQ